MSIKKIAEAAISQNPLAFKEALAEELRDRIRLAIEAKIEEETELEEKLIGRQKELDHNDNGKIDAHDFHLMRKKKEMKNEDVEQIDELKRSTLASYVKKAAGVGQRNTLPNAMRDRMTAAAVGDKEWYKQSGRHADNRSKGIQRAADRLAKEEVEQIDEISQEKLRDYHAAAGADRQKAKATVQKTMGMKKPSDSTINKASDAYKRFIKRGKGMTAAANKMTD